MESSLRVGGVEETMAGSGSMSQPTSASHCAEQALVGLSGACSPTTQRGGTMATNTSTLQRQPQDPPTTTPATAWTIIINVAYFKQGTYGSRPLHVSPTWHNADSLSTPDSDGKTERHSQAQSELRGPISGLYDIKSDCKSSDVLYYSFPEMVDLVEEVEPMQQA